MARQASNYSGGAAAGNDQARGNASANASLLSEQRASADSARAADLNLSQQRGVEQGISRQASSADTQQRIDAIRQAASLSAQEDAVQAQVAAARRQQAIEDNEHRRMLSEAGRRQDEADYDYDAKMYAVGHWQDVAKANVEARKVSDEARGVQLERASNEFRIRVAARESPFYSETFDQVVENAPDLSTALARIEARRRMNTSTGRPILGVGMASRLAKEAAKYYSLASI